MASVTPAGSFLERGTQFLGRMSEWERQLAGLAWEDLRSEAEQGHVAIISVDMIKGFCQQGALASPRVEGIIPAVVSAFTGAYAIGVRHFLLAQDSHPADAAEFRDFPAHCQVGTTEAETITALAELPFADLYQVVEKNSLNAFHGTWLGEWLDLHRDLKTLIIVGDCTDLCVYQMAMHLKLYGNAYNLLWRIIVPAHAVQTYDTPLDVADELGIFAHDGDMLHLTFLYHMRINGVEVVKEIV